MIRKCSLAFISLFIVSCGSHNPPNPIPTPTPVPTPPPNLLIRQPNPPRLVRDGQPFTPFGAVQCCMEYNPRIKDKKGKIKPRKPMPFNPNVLGVRSVCNTLWPLASECWMNYTHSKGANLYHFRMGPFYADENHEIEWMEFGGPYLAGPGSDFNPRFFEKYRSLLGHARNLNSNVEVVAVDTWGCKHAQWGDWEIPWSREAIESCGRRPNSEVERFIRKIVYESREFQNVIWITDNEGGQITGDTCAWFEWVRSIIRDEELKSGGAVRLVGINNTNCASGPFDYVATHERSALLRPIAGKHTENNERNPHFTPEQEYSNFCRAQELGLHYWFWRAGMSDADFERTLELFSKGCGGPTECFAPESNDQFWDPNPTPGGTKELLWPINSAKLAVGESCPTDHQGTLDSIGVFAAEMRKRGYCCSGPWGDALVCRQPDGRWTEWHLKEFARGCFANNPAVLPKFTWSYLGTPHKPQMCTKAIYPVDQINCKLHQATNFIYDCTPKAKGQPILPEGDPQRVACEIEASGGASPTFSVDNGLEIVTLPNPWQFQIRGSGTGLVTCKIPGNPNTLCNLQVER